MAKFPNNPAESWRLPLLLNKLLSEDGSEGQVLTRESPDFGWQTLDSLGDDISDLIAVTSLDGTETFPVIQSGTARSATLDDVRPMARTQAEIDASVTPTDFRFDELHAFRYMTDAQQADVLTKTASENVTTPLANAIAVAKQKNGEVFLPGGVYSANLTCTGTNYSIRGESFGFGSLGSTVSIHPATITDPALSVGDGTTSTSGLTFIGLNFDGNTSPTRSDEGVKINGARQIYFDHVAVRAFANYQVQLTSSTESTAHIFWSNYQISTAPVAGSLGIDHNEGSAFATAIFFENGTITSQAGASYALDLEAGSTANITLRLVNTWIAARNEQGIHFQGFAQVHGQNVVVDSGSASDELVTCDFASTDNDLNELFSGDMTIDGVAKFTDGTTAQLGGRRFYQHQGIHLNPHVRGSLSFQDSNASAFNQYATGNQSARISRTGDHLELRAVNGTVRAVASDRLDVLDSAGGGAQVPARAQMLEITDGVTAPSTIAGYASIYVDTADGDLKVKFGDGTVKTIVVDT